MPFYDELQQVARDLLAPDTSGGLGQGAITLVRTTPGTPDPSQPWVPVTPTVTTEDVNQISNTKAEYVSAGTIVQTDLAYVIEAPRVIQPKPGDTVKVGGVHVGGIVHCEPFPAHGVTVLVKLWVNR